MENAKVTRHWGVAAIIIAAVVIVAGAVLILMTAWNAKASPPQETRPEVIIQWQPYSLPEINLRARILNDNHQIEKCLKAIAEDKDSVLTPGDMSKDEYFGKTYFRDPQLWTEDGLVKGWGPVLQALRKAIPLGSTPVITSTSALIEYRPHPGGPAIPPDKDVDGVASIKFTFSCSPAGGTEWY
jgi:hypothetical protein